MKICRQKNQMGVLVAVSPFKLGFLMGRGEILTSWLRTLQMTSDKSSHLSGKKWLMLARPTLKAVGNPEEVGQGRTVMGTSSLIIGA